MRVVRLLGNEITDKIVEIPALPQTQGDYGQLTINDIPSIKADNRYGYFDRSSSQSPFYGENDLSKFSIEIEIDGEVVWTGGVQSIKPDNASKTSEIFLRSELQAALAKGIVYASLEEDTPANIVAEICSLYKIPIDTSSFSRSNAVYSENSVTFSAFFRGETTVLDAINQVAEFGVAAIFNNKNKLHFELYQERTVAPIITFSDKESGQVRVWSHPDANPLEKETIEGYRIETTTRFTATRGTDSQQGKSLNGTMSSPVRITSLQSAVWIGDLWFDYLNKPQERIRFDIPAELGKSMSLGFPITLEYKGKTIIGDVVLIDNSALKKSTIEVLTR